MAEERERDRERERERGERAREEREGERERERAHSVAEVRPISTLSLSLTLSYHFISQLSLQIQETWERETERERALRTEVRAVSNLSRRILGSIKPLSLAPSLFKSVILASLRLFIPNGLFRFKRHLRERAREREWGVDGGGSMARVEREQSERSGRVLKRASSKRYIPLHAERERGLKTSVSSSAQDDMCVTVQRHTHLDP